MSKTAPKAKTAEKPKSKVPFKKEITQKLLDAKEKILQEVSQKVKSESNVLKHEIGDIYDIASIERERELTLMLGDRDRDKLSEIEDALERIRDTSYGGCEECGEPIAEDRLRALPFTRVCVECQSKNERELKIKGGRYEEDTGLGIMERSESDEEEF
ncbi:MAG: TraR/DksA family transcriptional regulator [Deltaproteobacteria bacterium]|nr:TraR/DksA family transcriptional regulator [Deltaproteobacteria bacterium]